MAVDITPLALLEFAKTLKGGADRVGSARVATVTRIDDDGVAYVALPGGVNETPIATNGASFEIGDTVFVSMAGGKLRADSNLSQPSVGARIVTAATKPIERAVKVAKQAADEAGRVANAVNQHFWNDDNGAHVTDVTKDAWAAAVADNFSDLSAEKQYPNLLMNSLGILLRSALNNLVGITRSAIAFYDGLGNNATNIVAQFGINGAQIGKSSALQLIMTAGAMILKNDSNESVFSVTEDSTTSIAHSADLVTYASSSAVIATTYTVSDSLTTVGDTSVTLDVAGEVYELSASDVSVTVTAGTGVSIEVTSAGALTIAGILDDAEESGTLYVEYQAGHYDLATLQMKGNMLVEGEGQIIGVKNTQWSDDNQTGTTIHVTNAVTGSHIGLSIGTGGYNRGIYDYISKSWIIYRNSNDEVVVTGIHGSFSKSYNTVYSGALNSNAVVEGTTNITKAGWYPICVAGWSSSSRFGVLVRAYITNAAKGSGTINWMITNPSTSASVGTPTVIVHVLWAKC